MAPPNPLIPAPMVSRTELLMTLPATKAAKLRPPKRKIFLKIV